MGAFYKVLQVLAALIIGGAILWLLLALLSPLKTRCDALFPLDACRTIHACLSSLMLFVVGYFTLRRLKKIVDRKDGQ